MLTPISPNPALDPDKLFDWYVARFDPNLGRLNPHSKAGFVYPFGGTLRQVKDWIQTADASIRKLFTWVPKEYVLEDLFNIVNYPT